MTEDQLKQWAKSLLDEQSKRFAEQMQAFQPAPAPEEPLDFDSDPEKAVNALLKRRLAESLQPIRQQLESLSKPSVPATRPDDDVWRKAALPESDEAFDAESIGVGRMTWGDVRKFAEQSGDADALRQYTDELSGFRSAGKEASAAIPASKARVSFPHNAEPEPVSDEQLNADMMKVMNGSLSKDDFDKKYGVGV